MLHYEVNIQLDEYFCFLKKYLQKVSKNKFAYFVGKFQIQIGLKIDFGGNQRSRAHLPNVKMQVAKNFPNTNRK